MCVCNVYVCVDTCVYNSYTYMYSSMTGELHHIKS